MTDTTHDDPMLGGDFESRRLAAIAAAEGSAPPPPSTERVYEDYFGFGESKIHYLPDGVSWVEIKVMTEGEKRQYLNSQNRELVMNRKTDDTKLKMAPGDERYNLLKAGIKNWDMRRGGSPVPFTKDTLERFLAGGNPKLMDGIEKAIRLANPWLLSEMSIEDIDAEIESLQEMRAKKLEEDEGKGSSNAK